MGLSRGYLRGYLAAFNDTNTMNFVQNHVKFHTYQAHFRSKTLILFHFRGWEWDARKPLYTLVLGGSLPAFPRAHARIAR